MRLTNPSPKILGHGWGRLEIEGFGEFKDAKLYPGGARQWDWSETGTSHTPGIQLADAEELLEHGAREVILARGVLGNLKVPAKTISALEERGVTVHVARTPKAIELYNRRREKEAIGALIHSTC